MGYYSAFYEMVLSMVTYKRSLLYTCTELARTTSSLRKIPKLSTPHLHIIRNYYLTLLFFILLCMFLTFSWLCIFISRIALLPALLYQFICFFIKVYFNMFFLFLVAHNKKNINRTLLQEGETCLFNGKTLFRQCVHRDIPA